MCYIIKFCIGQHTDGRRFTAGLAAKRDEKGKEKEKERKKLRTNLVLLGCT